MPQKTRLKDTFIVVKVQPIPHTLNSNQRCFEIPFDFDFDFDFDSSSQKLKQNKASLPTVQCKQLVKSNLYTLPFFTSPNPFSSSSSNSPSPPRMKDHYSSMDEDPSSKNDALTTTLKNSIQALGRGFDVTSDIRLLYCKGAPGSRLIYLDDQNTKELVFSDDGFVAISNVPVDVEFSKGERTTEATPVCSFYEMAKYFNMKSNLAGDVPLGSFNAMFNFTGSWQLDAASTKSLAMIGYIVPLFEVRLEITDLVLLQEVKRAVPYSWDPASLASFIENYGTHIVTSATVGGRDVVYIKQHQSSPLSLADIDNYVKDIGEHRFFDLKGQSSSGPLKYKDKDVTVIFRRRGGDDLEQSHAKWAETVETAPDVINMTFTPIVSLLDGVPGIKHLTRAIELYLEYKPPIEDLQYFLEFQISRVWAPEQSNIQRKEPVCPSLQFSLMGPKLYISLEQVTIGRKPVTGLRLSLEGSKQNRLAIHIQHLVSLPKILQPHWDTHMAIGAPKWQGPEEQDSRWFEPIKWKNFSHVSTAPIEHTETYIGDLSGVHIVTGAQFGVWDFGVRSVLHLKLLFSKVPGCTIRRSVWDHSPANLQRAGEDKGDGSSQSGKLAKIVDMTEMSKGPQDVPGHWLVTGAKLGVDKGRIVLRIKYSLLNY